MCVRRSAWSPVCKDIAERNVIPAAYLLWTQMINAAQTEELVQAWYRARILKICQSADVNNELCAPVPLSHFVACLFHIAISEPQSLSYFP